MNFYGVTIATKRHASQSQGVHKLKMFTFYIKIHNNWYDINIIYVISLIRYRIQKQCATHTNICTPGKPKDIFSVYYEATKEENTKNTLKLSFNLF